MKRDNYVYAESYGQIFRFGKRRWKQMLAAVQAGREVKYTDYGTVIIPNVAHNITDLDAQKARYLLMETREG